MSTQVAFLGPEGTYAEKAAYALAKLEKLDAPQFVPCVGLRAVIENVAKKLCDEKVVSILEGGYNLNALKESVDYHVKSLLE